MIIATKFPLSRQSFFCLFFPLSQQSLECHDKFPLLQHFHCHDTVSIIVANFQLCSASGLCMIVATKFPLSRQSSVEFPSSFPQYYRDKVHLSLPNTVLRQTIKCRDKILLFMKEFGKFFIATENLLLRQSFGHLLISSL